MRNGAREEKEKEISARQCENAATMKRGTKTSTVITVVAAAAARTSDVWRGRIALGKREGERVVVGGDGLRGYEGASYRVADVILGAQGDFA